MLTKTKEVEEEFSRKILDLLRMNETGLSVTEIVKKTKIIEFSRKALGTVWGESFLLAIENNNTMAKKTRGDRLKGGESREKEEITNVWF